MHPDNSIYVRTLKWASDRGTFGFTLDELKAAVAKDEEEWRYVQRMFMGQINGDAPLIFHDAGASGNYRYFLTGSGAGVAVDYLELEEARRASQQAERNASQAIKSNRTTLIIAIVTLGVSVVVGCYQIWSTYLTQRGLEMSSDPILNITFNPKDLPNDTDDVTLAAGLIPLKESIFNLILVNNSASDVEQVDLRMTLWQLYVNPVSRHLTTCPLGYVSHENNPLFSLVNLGSTNLFNRKFSLENGEDYPFSLDLRNLNSIQRTPPESRILLKIDATFIKSATRSNHHYIKLFVLNSFGGNVLDPQVAPTLAMGLADRKEEVEWGDHKIPSLLYPFQQEEFLKYFDKSTPSLDLIPSGCREFKLLKELRTINY